MTQDKPTTSRDQTLLIEQQQRQNAAAAAAADLAAYGQSLLASRRRECGLPDQTDQSLQPTVNIVDLAAAWLEKSKSKVHAPKQEPFPIQPSGDRIKLHPDLGLAALRQGKTVEIRLWLILRWIDRTGAGYVSIPHLRSVLSGELSQFSGYSWQNLRKLLTKSDLWSVDSLPEYTGRIWYKGTKKAAQLLQVQRLTGSPVDLPLKRLKKLKMFKASLLDAFHSGRKHANPISQDNIHRITGIPARTQRHYCRISKIQRQANFAIGDQLNTASQQESAWRYAGSFSHTDHHGYQGPKGRKYTANRLPNAYRGTLTKAAKGSQRKINSGLINFANKGKATGPQSNREKQSRLFYDSGAAAASVYNRRQDTDLYWSQHRPKPGASRIWLTLKGVK